MLQLGDKNDKGYLDFDDCKNFPREELQIIDQLWLKYSDNKFGFSVQKQIYLELGGKLDNYDYESYIKIGDRLGWRNKILLSHSPFEFDNQTAPPEGHLPSFFGAWTTFIVIGLNDGIGVKWRLGGECGETTKVRINCISFLFSKL